MKIISLVVFLMSGFFHSAHAKEEMKPVLEKPSLEMQQAADLENEREADVDIEAIDAAELENNSPLDFGSRGFGNLWSAPADQLKIKVYKRSSAVGRQFMVIYLNGQIIKAHVVSTGKAGKGTPTISERGIYREDGGYKMKYIHDSGAYPSATHNNMRRAIYLLSPIAFHSTLPSLYYKLGTPDSHGCVRQFFKDSIATWNLVNQYGPQNTTVEVLAEGQEPPANQVATIRALVERSAQRVAGFLAKVPRIVEEDDDNNPNDVK